MVIYAKGDRLRIVGGAFKDFRYATFLGYTGKKKCMCRVRVDGDTVCQERTIWLNSIKPIDGPNKKARKSNKQKMKTENANTERVDGKMSPETIPDHPPMSSDTAGEAGGDAGIKDVMHLMAAVLKEMNSLRLSMNSLNERVSKVENNQEEEVDSIMDLDEEDL